MILTGNPESKLNYGNKVIMLHLIMQIGAEIWYLKVLRILRSTDHQLSQIVLHTNDLRSWLFVPIQVFLIQACQDSQPGSRPIVLKRPNTVLLHATVPDGTAVRGAYTSALAAQLNKTRDDGKRDLTHIHTEAIQAMEANGVTQQLPMLQSTLKKFLILDWANTSRKDTLLTKFFKRLRGEATHSNMS